jgi:hypothetical protein
MRLTGANPPETRDMNEQDVPARAMGGSCAGGVLGAILGVVIGGLLGPLIAQSQNDLKKNPDRAAQGYGQLLDPCFGAFGLIVGVVAGGIIGGIVGSVLGAGLATGASSSVVPSSNCERDQDASPSRDSDRKEIERLKTRLAELESRESKVKVERPPSSP